MCQAWESVRTDLPAWLAGPAGTGEPRQSPPHLCPPLLVLIPPVISEKSCWTLFFMDLWEGSWGSRVLGRSSGALPSCCPCSKTLHFWPPKPSCIYCKQLHEAFTRDLGLISHPSVVPPGWDCPARSSAPGQAQGLVGSSGLRFRSCAKLSQAACKQVNVSSLERALFPQPFSPGAGAQEHWEKAWTGG